MLRRIDIHCPLAPLRVCFAPQNCPFYFAICSQRDILSRIIMIQVPGVANILLSASEPVWTRQAFWYSLYLYTFLCRWTFVPTNCTSCLSERLYLFHLPFLLLFAFFNLIAMIKQRMCSQKILWIVEQNEGQFLVSKNFFHTANILQRSTD